MKTNITNLVTKAALNTKATEIEHEILDISHFINTQELNGLTKITFDPRMKGEEKSLASKTDVDNALNFIDKDRKIMEKLQKFDSSYFLSKSYFENDGVQNYLAFQAVNRLSNTPINRERIIAWQYKDLIERKH